MSENVLLLRNERLRQEPIVLLERCPSSCSKDFNLISVKVEESKPLSNEVITNPCDRQPSGDEKALSSIKSEQTSHQLSVQKRSNLHDEQISVDANWRGKSGKNSKNPAGHFACKLCPKVYRHACTLYTHMHTHNESKRFQCKYCDKQSHHRNTIKNHERLRHEGRRFLCDDCGQSFAMKDSLAYHVQNKHTEEGPERNFECTICQKKFIRPEHLKTHVQHVHAKIKPYACKYCEKRCSSTGNLSRHILIHEGVKSCKYSCTVCGKTLGTAARLKHHTELHNDDRKPYKCPSCLLKFTSLEALERHASCKHVGHIPASSEKPYCCMYCALRFIDTVALMIHMKRIHGHGSGTDCQQVDTNNYQCELCPKKFKKISSFMNHLRLHNGLKPHKCQHCDRAFTNVSRLRDHTFTHRAEDLKNLSCKYCSFTTAYRNSLVDHERLHTGIKPYKCTKCDDSFQRREQLKIHKLTMHSSGSVHCCPQCSKMFISKYLLKVHMAVHMAVHNPPEQLHACTKCDKQFTRKYLKQHYKTVHPAFMSYGCGRCGKVFKNKKSSIVHFNHYCHSNPDNVDLQAADAAIEQSPVE